MKKLLAIAAVVGAALFVFTKVRSRSGDDLWQQATSNS
ncbi:MAG: hypothetical protein QOI50_370 [Pseudonocardiales bacterium]|jgi:hypothetical protein|nr:hypothetical protein [Pseudonocardia sp.]MDT7558750.1 hypothetical protein [Pseudonocardiales bacterium]MDT7564486.1 hypothetical protein [Pseudonocardiales bacterium]MDT7585905.1 hypothetical protein [Pseudonocardiales bacterium]MDT7611324.1 hypothetical protein [Pseudonocardiales bacterium]